MDYEADTETGGPILPAQRCTAMARMYEDDTGEVVTETLVLPNMIVFFLIDPDTGTHIGDSRICSPAWSKRFIPHLLEVCEHVNECDNPGHAGRSMEMLDPEATLRGRE